MLAFYDASMLPLAASLRQVEQTPHETGLCNLSTNQNEFQVFAKSPRSNFYSAVWIYRANFIVPKEFSDILSVELTNRKQHLLWFVPQLIQNTDIVMYIFGWSQWAGKVRSGCFQFCKAQQGWRSPAANEASQVEAASAGWVGELSCKLSDITRKNDSC